MSIISGFFYGGVFNMGFYYRGFYRVPIINFLFKWYIYYKEFLLYGLSEIEVSIIKVFNCSLCL